MKVATGVASLVLASGLVFGGQAFAALEDSEIAANAAARCQGALPNYEGNLRKRPLGVINEGTAPAFATCAFEIDNLQKEPVGVDSGVDYFGVFLSNFGTTAATVTCTGVAGFETGTVQYASKGVLVPANLSGQGAIFFTAADFGGSIFPLTAVSCQLPPGTGINDTYIGYQIDDAV